MTYSILGYDPSNGDLGVAVQSKFPNVGGLVPYGQAKVGAVATQGFANPRHGSVGLELLRCGAEPRQVVDILLRGDDLHDQRQFAVVDAQGRSASHTGSEVHSWEGWAGDCTGDHCLALGNGLAGRQVAERMVHAFERGTGTFSIRLIRALAAGEAAGGELRGQQSAALLVLRENGGYGGLDDRHVTISIYDHRRPIEELERCYEIHKMSYFPSDPKNLVVIGPELSGELKQLMRARGFYDGSMDGGWESDAIQAFQRFMGWENYDNRIRADNLLDTEVLAAMRARRKQNC